MDDTQRNRLMGILASNERSADCDHVCRTWIANAVTKLQADARRSADTHVYALEVPALEGISIFLKDESAHPTGSLKHRLARSLMLYGLCNGCIGPGTVLVEASSGSTAVSEAYFARLLGLKFIAVVPDTTSRQKIAEIERYGGFCRRVEASAIYSEAQRICDAEGGYYLDQFTYAERATDWRGNNNIAESLFYQIGLEVDAVPDWVVVGAGTGGTSATIGRYVRFCNIAFAKTRVCVADPEGSVFFESYAGRDRTALAKTASRIEGVGRPRVEPSFIDTVVDRMIKVKDDASFAAMLWVEEKLSRRVGPSTGLNLYATLQLALEMKQAHQTGSLATLICDSGDRYDCTAYDEQWRKRSGIDATAHGAELKSLFG